MNTESACTNVIKIYMHVLQYMCIQTCDTIVAIHKGQGWGRNRFCNEAHKPQSTLSDDMLVVNGRGRLEVYASRS
jgi:hypothetical protein